LAIIAKNRTGSGVQYLLSGNQDLVVGRGVLVQSTGDNAVRAPTGKHDVTVAGTIIGAVHCIELGADVSGQRITIQKTGLLMSDEGPAMYIGGRNTTIVNKGSILTDEGIRLGGVGGGTTVVNSGIIAGGESISVLNDQKLVLRNTGIISSPDSTSVQSGAANDSVINLGKIVGEVSLGAGNDLYDGRRGLLTDGVNGNTGDDRFVLGRAAERVEGGLDTDTVDYRASGSVTVSLDASLAGKGNAAFDTFNEVENLLGSLRGGDRLRGNINNNLINGFGGHDRIEALAGQDTLVGGAGKDLLNGGGPGDDFFRFDKPSDGGDRIQDFSSLDLGDNDTILISRAGFQSGLALGVLGIGRFKSGGNNQAGDGNDRFIFRTGDETLWFDRDGTGGAAPVLIADLQNGATMTYQDIIVFGT
jgi:Ca2+-binding RTX toxin-like protein